MPSDQSRTIEQVKFTYSPLDKAFEKQKKQLKNKGKKQIDAITNRNKRLEDLTNKDDYKSIYKEISGKLVKGKFDEEKN